MKHKPDEDGMPAAAGTKDRGGPTHRRPGHDPACCASPSSQSIGVLGSTRRALCGMVSGEGREGAVIGRRAKKDGRNNKTNAAADQQRTIRATSSRFPSAHTCPL